MSIAIKTRRHPTYLQNIFAKNLFVHRSRLGITQDELADKCGFHRTYIGSVERAERNITLATIEVIASVFAVEPYTLLIKPDE